MPEADSSDLKTCGSQATTFTLKTLQVMRSMEQFFLRGRARNGFLNQCLVEARPWDFLLNNCLKTRADCKCVYGSVPRTVASADQREARSPPLAALLKRSG